MAILKDWYIDAVVFGFSGCSIKCPLKLFSILKGASIEGKNMLPMGLLLKERICSLKGAYFYHRTYSLL